MDVRRRRAVLNRLATAPRRGAYPESRHRRGCLEVPALERWVEHGLVDEAGFNHPVRSAQQQDRRPTAASPSGHLPNQQCPAAVQQHQDQQCGKPAYGHVAEQKLPDPRGAVRAAQAPELRASFVDFADRSTAQHTHDHFLGRGHGRRHAAVGFGVPATEEAVGQGQYPTRGLLVG